MEQDLNKPNNETPDPMGTPLDEKQDNEEEEDNRFFIYKEITTFENIPPNSIDDDFGQTIARELQLMAYKFSVVLCPTEKRMKRLKSWDLWGPFFMVLTFGVFINNAYQFLLLFLIAFGGAVVVTFNTRVLGGKITFFESVSILGYCIFPLFLMGGIIKLLTIINFAHLLIKLLLVLIGTFWGVFSAKGFIAVNVEARRRTVALYPIFLFYCYIGIEVMYL